jgi:hypothetical protein
MPNEGTLPAAKIEELTNLLQTGLFEDFMKLFKANAREFHEEGAVTLADQVNKALLEKNPDCDMKLVVSQRTNEKKHLIMIMDNSRFWGDSFTITRQMFTV